MSESKLTLLLVDDDEDDYAITSDKLREIPGLEYDVDWVQTYEAAVHALTTQTYSICITDYNLRRTKTGIDLIAKMRAEGCKVPFIMLTGQGTLALCVDAGTQGANDFFDKNAVTPAQLGQAIQRALRLVRTTDKMRQTEEQLRRLTKE